MLSYQHRAVGEAAAGLDPVSWTRSEGADYGRTGEGRRFDSDASTGGGLDVTRRRRVRSTDAVGPGEPVKTIARDLGVDKKMVKR